MYLSLLSDSQSGLPFKNRVLDLLPFFAVVTDGKEMEMLKEALDGLVANNFPLRSCELVADAPPYDDYIGAIDKLLIGLRLSGSHTLLELLISILCREPRHAHEESIQAALAQFTRRLPQDKQKTALDVPYGIFAAEGKLPLDIRRATLERVCLPMLRLVRVSALKEFYLDHITEIMTMLDTKVPRNPESAVEAGLVSHLCCFQLLELLYSRLERDDVNSKNSIINDKFTGGKSSTGKELTQKATKAAHEARSEDVRGETTAVEPRRQYHCHAHNLLISIISCVQTEHKFYDGFLFKDNPAKGQFILESIVDTNRKHEFKVELTAPMERKKRFVSLRHEARQSRRGSDEDNDEDDLSSASSTNNLASLYLAGSSLSEDLNQFDFSMSGTGQSATGGESRPRGLAALRKRSSTRASSDDQDTSVAVVGDFLELEVDDLNQHECMAPLVALLRHLVSAKIYPPPERGATDMPGWMQGFYKTFCSAATHTNIKLFVAKLITNTAQIFEPYASFWLRPLCQLVVGGEAGEGINTLVVDVLVTMLSWHGSAIPKDNAEERALASRVVEFLIANIYHETRAIFRNNLELLKTVLECWQARLDIPYHLIFKELAATESRSKNDCVGIQILGAVIAAKFPAYGPSAPVDRERYILTLAKGMTKSYKAVFGAAAEVVGMVLRQLEDREKLKEGDIHDEVAKVLNSLSTTKPTNFIVCLHCIQRHYAPLADRFLSKLLFILPKLHGEMRTQSLEVVLSRIDQLENPYLELKTKGLHSFLAHRDEGTQSVALRIVLAMSARLLSTEMLELLPVVTAFAHHPSASCRSTMYNILMWIYDNYRSDTSAQGPEVMRITKDALLRGMADEDLRCRLLVQNFWSSESRLPGGTVERLVAMLEALYSPATESQFLSYATGLLMEMTSKSPDYNRPVFEHPLSECRFQDVSIKADWRQRHAVMTPLFASTLASQTEDSGVGEDSLDGRLRATMDAQQFSATQGPSRGPYNWLTQSSLDTFSETAISLSLSASSDSSLLFSTGSQEGRRSLKSRPSRPRPGFGTKLSAPQPSTSASRPRDEGDGKKEEQQPEIWRLKRRFVRDQEASQIYFARRTSRLKQMREEAKKEQQARRENHVTLYRKYRIGDLPDIQIHYSYIIAPLQALAHHDNSVAQMLFGSVFKAIFKALDDVKTETEVEEVKQQMNRSLEFILSHSTQYFTPFIACLLDILYELRKNLKADSASVALVANKSNLQALGIMVLEEQFNEKEAQEPAAKRSRSHVTPTSSDHSNWFELAKLYKSQRNYDVLQGIFSRQEETKGQTLDAMAAEARGDYNKACEFYDKAIKNKESEEDKERLQYEEDFWDEGRMECLNKLAKWHDLEEAVVAVFDNDNNPNLNKIWEYNSDVQAFCLPMLMRAKVKLLLQGDKDQQPLLKFVDDAMQVPDHRLVLETWYPLELSLLHLWQEDYDRARFFCSHAAQGFLQTWSSTDALMTDSRASQIQRLQLIQELHEFLQFMAEQKVKPSEGSAAVLVRCWKRRLPHPLLDSTSTWEDVVTNRSVFLDQMNGKLSSGLEPLLQEVRVQQRLAMVEACCQQNNFARSLRILKETHPVVKETEELLCEWSHLYATVHHAKYSRVPFSATTAGVLFTTLGQLEKCKGLAVLGRRPDLARRQGALWADGCQKLCLGLAAQPHIIECLENDSKKKMASYADCKDLSNKQKVFDGLAEHSCTQLRAAVGREGDREDAGSCYAHGAALLALAKYCDKFLRANEDAEGENLISPKAMEAFPETVVVCMLRAMKHGNVEARERYPRLLQLVDVYPGTRAAFIRQASEVPSWMFLGWLSQMIALLDKAEASAVHDILLHLAEEYPQAVIYPFRISCEGFNFEESPEGPQNKAAVEKLATLLGEDRVPLVSKFISALDQFGQPDMLFKDWADDMAKLLKSSRRNKEAIKERYLEMYNMLIADKPSGSELYGSQLSFLSATANVGFGEYRKKFAETFRKDFDVHFGKEGKKLADMNAKEFQSVRVKLNAEFEKHKDKRGKLVPPTRLHEYCQWMADFRPSGKAGMLEIPGQYTGRAKPLPEYHVKVAGFDERVLVMSSLRKPKRITIRGNDEHEYHYLVKGGEDLRLDQRIEQLFSVANGILAKDAACSLRNLQLKTYQVIPMTPRVGLIEWISHTMPLKNFLENAMTEEEKRYHDSEHGPARQHQKWTGKFYQPDKRVGPNPHMYQQVYLKYTRSETIKEFHSKEKKVPKDLSRRAFHQLSTSPEAFFVLRNMFASSHATLCICQYILGIGDRHLSNFMVNLQTGQMIGIDFGHAFGSATQFLPVPELMPFRLTRQILNVTLPLGAKGLVENTMVHVLRAIRADHDLLLNTMDVFVKEPSLDWLQLAEKQMQVGMEPEDAETDMSWYPRQKIQFAKRKLKGDKPSIITRDEMMLGHSRSPAVRSLEQVVLGADDAVRSSLPDSELPEEDQVAALIDQATDPNLLGRVWAGWEAWV